MNWDDVLRARLLELQPASVTALDESARRLANSVLRGTPVQMPDMPPDAPSALALGIDALNGLTARQALQLINQTRLYAAPRILLAVPLSCILDEPMFRALGFTLSATDAAEQMRVHFYDLDTYKTVPDWLNTRYWAHPERWEP